MFQKILFFFVQKRVDSATGAMTQVSKTKVFMLIEGLLRAVEFVSPYLGHPIKLPEQLHIMLYSLAGIAYRDALNPSPPATNP